MKMNIKEVDITENICGGDVEHIISVLRRWKEIGFDRLYFDGYDAAIYLYKSNHSQSMTKEECTCLIQEILHDKICKRTVMKEDPFEVYERRRDCPKHSTN